VKIKTAFAIKISATADSSNPAETFENAGCAVINQSILIVTKW